MTGTNVAKNEKTWSLGRFGSQIVLWAVFFSVMPELRLSSAFFTLSDFLFIVGGVFLLLGTRGKLLLFPSRSPALGILWYLGVLLLLTGLAMSTILRGASVPGFVIVIQYTFALIYVPIVLANMPKAHVTKAIVSYILGIFMNIVLGSIVYFLDVSIPFTIVTGNHRLQGLLDNPNVFAGVIGSGIPFLLFLEAKKIYSKLILRILMIFTILGLMLASSFGGILTAIISTVAFFQASRRMAPLIRLMITLVLAYFVVVSGIGLPEVFEQRVISSIEQSGSLNGAGSYTERQELNSDAWQIIRDNTGFLGIGADSFLKMIDDGNNPHNTFLLLWVEGGITALLGMLILMSVPLAAVFSIRKITKDRTYSALVFASFSVLCMYAMTNTHLYARFWFLPVLICAALTFHILIDETSLPTKENRRIV